MVVRQVKTHVEFQIFEGQGEIVSFEALLKDGGESELLKE